MVLTKYVVATRPWSFTASLLPSILGNVLSYSEHGHLSAPVFCYVLACVLFVHCAGNLVNSYYDFVNGIDTLKSDDKTIASKSLSARTIFYMFLVSYLLGSASFYMLCQHSTANIHVLTGLFVSGLVGSFVYTGGVGMKYYALGDVVIMATFGPLAAYFAYVAQGGLPSSVKPLIYVLPLTLQVEAILHGNNTRDYATDKKCGILTLPILLGDISCSYFIYVFLLVFPYVVVSAFVVSESVFFVLPLFTCPLAYSLTRRFQAGELATIPQECAQLNLLFGGLYISAFILNLSFS